MKRYKIFNRILVLILFVLIFCVVRQPTYAIGDKNINNNLSRFQDVIYNKESFKKYADEIISLIAWNQVMTDEGYRISVFYELETEEGERKLVYVGNDNFEILFSGIVEHKSNKLSVVDFSNNSTESISLLSQPDCETFRCTQTKTKVNANWDKACGTILGSQCKQIAIDPFSYILCRALVVIECADVGINKVCVQGSWVPYCEY